MSRTPSYPPAADMLPAASSASAMPRDASAAAATATASGFPRGAVSNNRSLTRPSMMRGSRALTADMLQRTSTRSGMERPVFRSLGMHGAPPASLVAGAGAGLGRPSFGPRGFSAPGLGAHGRPKPQQAYRSVSAPKGSINAFAQRPVYRSLSLHQPAAAAPPAPFGRRSLPPYAMPTNVKSAPRRADVAPTMIMTAAPGALEGVVAPPLPPAPYTLERFTNFEVPTPSSPVAKLRAAIEATGATVKFDAAAHQLKGTAECSSTFNAVTFSVQVFRSPTAGHVVEFQRWTGCCMAWHAFYDSVLSRCDDLDASAAAAARGRVAKREKRAARTRSGAAAAEKEKQEACDGASEAVAASGAGLAALTEMAKSDFVEQQLEACRSLAQLASHGPTARAIARDESCLASAMSLLRSEEGDVQRCAVAAVANVAVELARPPPAAPPVLAALRLGAIAPMVSVVAARTPRNSGHLAETRRHAARALGALAEGSEEAAADIAACLAATPAAAEELQRMARTDVPATAATTAAAAATTVLRRSGLRA